MAHVDTMMAVLALHFLRSDSIGSGKARPALSLSKPVLSSSKEAGMTERTKAGGYNGTIKQQRGVPHARNR
jgi:hypothetical protein